MMTDKGLGVYVHIPYCASKCGYCDFNSTAAPNASDIPEARYADCIAAELRSVVGSPEWDRAQPGPDRLLRSIYVGGGTPTVFSPASIAAIIERVSAVLPSSEGAEVTVEANPESASVEKLRAVRAGGANRLSIGVQSLDDAELSLLGRPHSSDDARRAVDAARRAGFTNLSLDLIFSIPGHGLGAWERTLRGALALGPEHVSLYGLTIEERTPFHRLYGGGGGAAGSPALPAAELGARLYELAIDMLTSAGYVHYEVSNFAHPGRESVHNTGYWTGRDYIGLGAGAHSYLSHPGWGRRWANISDAGTYMAGVERGGSVREFTETLGPGEAMAENVMLSLRLLGRGIVDADFAALFGVTLSEAFGAALERLVAGGMLEWMDGRLVLTRAGLLVADSVVSTLLAGAGPGAVKG